MESGRLGSPKPDSLICFCDLIQLPMDMGVHLKSLLDVECAMNANSAGLSGMRDRPGRAHRSRHATRG